MSYPEEQSHDQDPATRQAHASIQNDGGANESSATPSDSPGLTRDHVVDRSPNVVRDTVVASQATNKHTPASSAINPADIHWETRQTIPGYEILGELGRGGMGVVYQARHLRLHRLCALKMVLAGRHAAPEALVRLLGEAEAVAKLRHPNIVAIHQIGEHEGLPFIELEFLAGGSLASRLDGTPLPSRQAAELVSTLANAVHAAHEAGVVHRDLKPANVLLDEHGTPKVADFGVAKALGSDTSLTATDSIIGSPSYMAPEQAAGRSREVGRAADVYALGAVLYELLTGRPPFKSPTVLETLDQVRNSEPVLPSQLVTGLPKDIEVIALKCLRKEPERRYASALALSEDLGRYLRGEPIVARRISPAARMYRWCRRNPVVAGLLAALLFSIHLGFAGVSSQWFRAEQQREELRKQNAITSVKLALRESEVGDILQAEERLDDCPEDLRAWEWHLIKRLCHREDKTLQRHEWHVWDVEFGPKGDRLASVGGGWLHYTGLPGRGEVLVLDADTGRSMFEVGGLRHGQFAAAFDPASDGRILATGGGLFIERKGGEPGAGGDMVVEGVLSVWDTLTGERRILDEVEGQNVIDVAYSPNGTVLAAAYGVHLHPAYSGYVKLWNTATGQPIGDPILGGSRGVSSIAFSADGRSLAIAKGYSEDGRFEIETWDWQAQQRVGPTIENEFAVMKMAFDPTDPPGRFLAVAEADSSLVRLWDVDSGEEAQVFKGHKRDVSSVRFRSDGKILATCGLDNLIKLWDVATGREIESLRGHAHFVLSVDFDPEGDRLVSGDLDGSLKLWETEPAQPVQIETDGWPYRVAFHPDGRRLVTATMNYSKGFAPQLWDLDSGRLVHSFIGHEGPVSSVSINKSGSLMASASSGRAVSSPSDQTVRIWDIETGREMLVLEHEGSNGVEAVSFHPVDNNTLATACYDGTVRLWTIDLTGHASAEMAIVDQLDAPVVALAFRPPGGRDLAAGTMAGSIHVRRLGAVDKVFEISNLGLGVFDVAFSPDGSSLAATYVPEHWAPSYATVWDMETGRVRQKLGVSSYLFGIAFSPDGSRLATADDDRKVVLWNLETGQELLTLRGHTEGVRAVAFSPNGHRLATGGIDQRVLVWDATPFELSNPSP